MDINKLKTPVWDNRGDWTYYKSKEVVPKGRYLKYYGRPTPEDKQVWPFYGAQINGKFHWVLKAESWALKELFGQKIEYYTDDQDLESLGYTPETIRGYIGDFRGKTGYDLRDWQRELLEDVAETLEEGVAYRKMVLAPTGAGKSQIIFAFVELAGPKCLIVGPRSTWKSIKVDAKKFGLKIKDLTFSTYESAHKKLSSGQYKTVICDEPQAIKNPEAQRSISLTEALENVPVVIAQTGTLVSAKEANDLRGYRIFGDVFPAKEKNVFYRYGINPREEIVPNATYKNNRGEEVAVKKTKVDGWEVEKIFGLLNEYTFVVNENFIDKEIKKEYNIVEVEAPNNYSMVVLGAYTKKTVSKRRSQARQITGGTVQMDDKSVKRLKPERCPKLQKLSELVQGRIKLDEKVIIVSAFVGEQTYIREHLANVLGNEPAMIASTTNRDREFVRFNDGETPVIILSAKQTEGLNLQAANTIIFYSNDTSPAGRLQAEARAWRSGQTRDVEIIDLVAKNTLDGKCLELLQKHVAECERLSGFKRALNLGLAGESITKSLSSELSKQAQAFEKQGLKKNTK